MKKYILLTASGVLFFVAANADQSVLAVHEEPVVVAAEPEPEPQPAVIEQVDEYNCPFCGVYLTLGVGGSFLKNKIDGHIGQDQARANIKSDNQNVNRVIGVVGLGGGKVFNDTIYVGGDILCDFSSSKEKNVENITVDGAALGAGWIAKIKTAAVIPSVALRLGYFNKNAEILLFTKIAASYTSSTLKANNGNAFVGEEKISKFAPALGLGIEKAFSKKFSGRLEGEYRFNSRKDAFKAAGAVNVRALVAYHINGI
ncbi:MAG: outer membrane beta-barrel protein [Holosporaceae bacterium]|jgi:opacity protein-like surface antigen|nr:outer membrane beta-barrel protein [Holosporaceae bacterium]